MSGGRWAVWAGARSTWTRFRDAARETPRAAWNRWLPALAAGYAATALLMAGLTLVAQRLGPGLERWDQSGLRTVAGLPFFSFQVAVWWESFGSSALLTPLVAAAVVIASRARRPLLALTLAASYLFAKPLILVGWNLWDRARPTLIAGGIAAPPFHSFASGHALQAAAIYGLLASLWLRHSRSMAERLLVVLLWLGLVAATGVARLRLGAHWPSDVLAGAVVGIAWAATLIVALRRAEAAGGR